MPPLTRTREQITCEFYHTIFLKALVEGRIVGAVKVFEKDRTCYVEGLAVHPEFQGEEVETKLISEAERLFSRAHRFELFTGNRSRGKIFQYQKLGYRIFRIEDISDSLEFLYLEKYRSWPDVRETCAHSE